MAQRSQTATATDVIESFDPATGELLGEVQVTPPQAVAGVAEEAARIQRGWALTPLLERLRVMERAVEVLLDRRDELARTITRETGKTVMESATMEIAPTAMMVDWLAKHGPRYLGTERLRDTQLVFVQKRHSIEHVPLGVVGVIAPWNYPFSIPATAVAMALAAGNAVLLKPSEHTPLMAEAIAEVFREAGLPDGLLRLVHGAGATGAALCEAPAIAKIFFTGSTSTGQRVLRAAAKHGIPAILELGGKDPAIVCADADLDRAVDGTLWAAVANAGQTCAGVERIYVDRRVHDEFLSRLVAAAEQVRPGDPQDPDTQVGPMNNEMQYRVVAGQLEDAVENGAKLHTGGPVEVSGLSGRFIAPAVLSGVDHSMKVMQEETFGPLIPVMPFDSEDEAVKLANDSEYGLGASVWSRDAARARSIADRLETGMVWINDHAYSHAAPHTPWGGTKASGFGVTHSKYGLYSMTRQRLVAEDGGRIPSGWWYPYDETKRQGFLAFLETMVGPGMRRHLRTAVDRKDILTKYFRGLVPRR